MIGAARIVDALDLHEGRLLVLRRNVQRTFTHVMRCHCRDSPRRSPQILEKLLSAQLARALQIAEAMRRGRPVYSTAARPGRA